MKRRRPCAAAGLIGIMASITRGAEAHVGQIEASRRRHDAALAPARDAVPEAPIPAAHAA